MLDLLVADTTVHNAFRLSDTLIYAFTCENILISAYHDHVSSFAIGLLLSGNHLHKYFNDFTPTTLSYP